MFSQTKLLLRNLRYFRAANLAVILGTSVATAVLTGALLVGDSDRASLTDLASRRLQWVDHALISPRMISLAPVERSAHGGKSESLIDALRNDPDFSPRFEFITPGVILRGSVSVESASASADQRPRVPGVQILALRDRVNSKRDTAWINSDLAAPEHLNLAHLTPGTSKGPALRFTIPSPEETPRDSALAKRSRNETISSIAAATSILAEKDSFRDLFDLTGGQRSGPTAWVSYEDLQDLWNSNEQANLILAQAKPNHSTAADAGALNDLIRKVAEPADFGLELLPSADKSQAVLASKSTYLPPRIVDQADSLAKEQSIPLQKVSVYLINHVVTITDTTRDTPIEDHVDDSARPRSQIHYAIAAGIDQLDGQPLRDDQVILNRWMADQLGAVKGTRLRLDYYLRQPNGELAEVRSNRPGVGQTFEVAGIIEMSGIGADSSLTPTYKGLTDAQSFSDWRPPQGLNINKKLVSKADDAYWGKYKGAPKLFVSLNAARKLWGSGAALNPPPMAISPASVSPLSKVSSSSKPSSSASIQRAWGWPFAPFAPSSSPPQAGAPISVSFSAPSHSSSLPPPPCSWPCSFASLLKRARVSFGLLAAAGFSPRKLRGICLREGLILAILGALLGLIGAVAYTALIVHGLRTWWVDAIGTTALGLRINPLTLAGGFVGSVIIALLAIYWATRRVSKTGAASLLAGSLGASQARLAVKPRLSLLISILALLISLALFTAGALGKLPGAAAYLGGGATLLLAALAFTFARLRPSAQASSALVPTPLSLLNLALRNATRNRARSLLCVALIALACFTLVTVSSMESGTPNDTHDPKSGAGGFTLMIRTDIPLLADLNTLQGRQFLMRQESATDPRWNKAHFAMLRTWAGQDVSCLNITRPDSPTLIAIPPSLAAENRFTFARTIDKTSNPWSLLTQPQSDGDTIPVIADDETAQYILKLGLGETLNFTDAAGRPRKLKLVATLSGSIFQSEMLVGEVNFLRLFPAQSGFSTILVDAKPADLPAVSELLNQTLNDTNDQEKSDYSATLTTTAARLQAYHQVANTYISTFRALGALGLMLGTIGLAVVLIRNLFERRAELTLLGALGFAPNRRHNLILLENSMLLAIGLAIGTLSALAGVIPNVLTSAHVINVRAVIIALALVIVVGMISLLIATKAFARRVSPAALRTE